MRWDNDRLRTAAKLIVDEGNYRLAAAKLSRLWGVFVTQAQLRGVFLNKNMTPKEFLQRLEAGTLPIEIPRKPLGSKPTLPIPVGDVEAPAWQSYRPVAKLDARPKSQPKVSPAKTMRGIVIPDSHVPRHHKESWSIVLGILRDWRPHFGVIIGDFGDFEALSMHPKSQPDVVKLAHEYYAINVALDELQEACYDDTDWYYIEGNHENRAARYVNAVGTLDGILTVPEQLYITASQSRYHRTSNTNLRKKMRWVSYEEQPLILPHSAYYHGHLCTSKHHAAWHAETYCPSRTGGKPLFYGHMHTFQSHQAANGSFAQCGGFLGDEPALRYTQGKPTPWVHGIILQEVAPDGTMTYTPVVFKKNRAVFQGKIVTAR